MLVAFLFLPSLTLLASSDFCGKALLHKNPDLDRILSTSYLDPLFTLNPYQAFINAHGVKVVADIKVELPTDFSQRKVLVVATHRTGILDGIAIASWMQSIHPSTKLLATWRIPSLDQWENFLIIGDKDTNGRTLRQMMRQLKEGSALVVFPGERVTPDSFNPWQVAPFFAALYAQADILLIDVQTRLEESLYAQTHQDEGFLKRLSVASQIKELEFRVARYFPFREFKGLSAKEVSAKVKGSL